MEASPFRLHQVVHQIFTKCFSTNNQQLCFEFFLRSRLKETAFTLEAFAAHPSFPSFCIYTVCNFIPELSIHYVCVCNTSYTLTLLLNPFASFFTDIFHVFSALKQFFHYHYIIPTLTLKDCVAISGSRGQTLLSGAK